MKIILLTVGKTLKGWIKDGLDVYVSRLSHYVNFEVKEIPELKNVSAFSHDQIKTREAELILKFIRPEDKVVLLDERGEMYGSVQWAQKLQKDLSRGDDIVFVVGGSYGFDQKVYDRANGRISLSKMTFSHQMVRVIFAEQLYRAFTIMKGEPYHNE